MELSFQKLNGQWVAEFEATSDFNINLDRVGKGALTIYLKGSKDGTYASQASYRNIKDSENIDADITALVYPKYIKVVSQTEVVKAIVTMEGESGGSGAKIVPYTKDITIEDKTIEELIPLSVDEEGYYNYGTEIPGLYIDVIITDAKVFIGEVNMVGYNNSSDSIEGIDIVPSYVDKSTNILITAGSRNMGGGSPVIKFKLMEIL